MKKNEVKDLTRLTLADFKIKKMDNQDQVDKLLGGIMAMAASCHQISFDPSPLHTNDKFDDR